MEYQKKGSVRVKGGRRFVEIISKEVDITGVLKIQTYLPEGDRTILYTKLGSNRIDEVSDYTGYISPDGNFLMYIAGNVPVGTNDECIQNGWRLLTDES